MTPLRQRMIEDMKVRNLAPLTQETYLRQVSQFARHFGRSPEALGPEEIRAYQVYLATEKQLSPTSIGIAVAALRFPYNSCSNRHCPKCQSLARAQWLEDRESELLDSEYFHVVFTVPEEIANIASQNKRAVYSILFRATAETLQTIAADPKHLGAQIGFFAVLHTWGQNLVHHPHLHCVIPGGGLSPDGLTLDLLQAGILSPGSCSVATIPPFVSPVSRRRFRIRQVGVLRFPWRTYVTSHAFRSYTAPLKQIEWVVYAKAPFAGPRQVLDYVGRYTHRVAISNNRLLAIEEGNVRFQWKDYRDHDRQKTMTLCRAAIQETKWTDMSEGNKPKGATFPV